MVEDDADEALFHVVPDHTTCAADIRGLLILPVLRDDHLGVDRHEFSDGAHRGIPRITRLAKYIATPQKMPTTRAVNMISFQLIVGYVLPL